MVVRAHPRHWQRPSSTCLLVSVSLIASRALEVHGVNGRWIPVDCTVSDRGRLLGYAMALANNTVPGLLLSPPCKMRMSVDVLRFLLDIRFAHSMDEWPLFSRSW